jgi:dipeptidyl aminopeptidase/acylaminoacyl peptidase
MSNRLLLFLAGLLLGIIVIPVLIAQINRAEPRALRGVELQDTTYEEVRFHNPAQDLQLAGMLFQPEGEGPFPAVVVIHGAGSSQRANPWYLSLASYLQDSDIAVLLPDKRGSESSAGDWRTASFQDLATDTLAAISFLQERYPEQISEIGILGASQGGQVAPIVATQSQDVAFVINVVGSAVPFHEALVYEESHNLREIGFLPGIANAVAPLSAWCIRNVAQKGFWDAIGNHDPLPYWAEVDEPVLVLYGDRDTNTPSRASADNLNALGKPNLRVVIFRGSGHPLEDPEGSGDRLFREDALAFIRDFVRDAVPAP